MTPKIPEPKYSGNLDDFINMLLTDPKKLQSVILQGNAAWYFIRKLGISGSEVFEIWNKDNPDNSIAFTDKPLYPKETPSNCEFYNKDYYIPCKSPDKFYECEMIKIGNQIKLNKATPSKSCDICGRIMNISMTSNHKGFWMCMCGNQQFEDFNKNSIPLKCEFCGRELILYNKQWICGHGCMTPTVKPKDGEKSELVVDTGGASPIRNEECEIPTMPDKGDDSTPSKVEFEHIAGCQCTECKPKEGDEYHGN